MKLAKSASLFLLSLAACHGQTPNAAPADRWAERFKALDTNHDGVLTQEEAQLRPRMFQRGDTNGDGKLSLEEALALADARAGRAASLKTSPAETATAAGIRAETGIVYVSKPAGDANLQSLDIYRPEKDAADPLPVVVYIHGGGWRIGDKANRLTGTQKAPFFVKNGFLFISINYRLSPGVQHPAHVEDTAAALAWVMDHIAEHGGDPKQIFLIGHSAGAHLAALVATDDSYLKKLGKSLAPIKGMALLDTAAYDIPKNVSQFSEGAKGGLIFENAFGKDEKVWKDASPIYHVAPDKNIPPCLAFYVDRDRSSVISKEFVAALNKAGVPATTIHASGRNHEAINQDLGSPTDTVSQDVLEFFKGKKPSAFPPEI